LLENRLFTFFVVALMIAKMKVSPVTVA